MTPVPYTFSFGAVGNSLDAFFSAVESRAMSAVPSTDYLKSTMKNAVPRFSGDFSVDLTETDEALIITCDLPGFEKADVSVKLLDSETLSIKAQSCLETVSAGTYHLRERRTDTGQRKIRLPAEVTAEGAKAVFKNGTLEIVLMKIHPDEGEEIIIE